MLRHGGYFFIRSRFDRAHKIDHFNGGHGAVVAFVAGFAAGALDGLLDVFCGDDAEEHRHAAVERNVCDALGGFVADEVVMAGGAAARPLRRRQAY